MLLRLILLFTIVPVLELAILIKVGAYIGVGPTVLVVILTGVLGATLAKIQGLGVLRKIQDNLNDGIIPTSHLFDGLLILIAAALLVTPGLLTDATGFFLLIPHSRNFLKGWLRRKADEMIHSSNIHITFFKR